MISSLPEKRILFERRCYLLQLRLNLTNILPAFFPLQPFQSELYRMSFDQRVFVHRCQRSSLVRCPYFKSSTSILWNGSERRRPSDQSGIYEQKMLVDIYHIQDQVI